MLPTQYGLNAYSPEAFAANAVEDLLRKTGKDALHTTGAPTIEYLGMLALYALRRSTLLFPDDKESFGKAFKLARDNFDPFNMSDNLVRCLTDILNAD